MAGIGFNSGYSPYTGAGNLASVYGASPTFGSGYTGGYGSGGYQYPNNVGGVNYSSSAPSGYAWGPNGLVPIGQGAAGIQAYNPAIATSPTRSFEQPTFTNSMSNWLGGSGADVANSVYADMPSPYATEMASTGGSPYPGFTQNSQGEWVADSSSGGGGAASPFGAGWGSAASPTTGSTWDPQDTAYNMVVGQNGVQSINQEPNGLAQRNLARYGNAFNQFGNFANPNAGLAMAGVAGAESSGNPFAVNSIGASGMNQWLNTPGSSRGTNASNLLGGSSSSEGYYKDAQGNWQFGGGGSGGNSLYSSPEMQGALAAGEMMGGGSSLGANTFNNPNASLTQLRQAGVGQFEGLQGDPNQMAADMKNSAAYATSPLGAAIANIAQQPVGRY